MNEEEHIFAAFNTSKANWLEIILARLFGKRVVSEDPGYSEDSGVLVTMYYWRGKYYLWDWSEIDS